MNACRIVTKKLLQKICLIFVLNTLLFDFSTNSNVYAQATTADEVIKVVSGNTEIGSKDSRISYYPILEFNGTLTDNDFANARSSDSVTIRKGENYLYLMNLNDWGPTGIIFSAEVYINPKDLPASWQVLSASTEVTPIPTEVPQPTAQPTSIPTTQLSPTPVRTVNKEDEEQASNLPETGGNINLALGSLAAGIWAYYFYLRYKIS